MAEDGLRQRPRFAGQPGWLGLTLKKGHLSGVIAVHPLRSGVTVARLALNQLVKVQILAPQLKKQSRLTQV